LSNADYFQRVLEPYKFNIKQSEHYNWGWETKFSGMFDPPMITIEESLNRLNKYCHDGNKHIHDWGAQIHAGLIFSKRGDQRREFETIKNSKKKKFKEPSAVNRDNYQEVCEWIEGMTKEILRIFRVIISEEQAAA